MSTQYFCGIHFRRLYKPCEKGMGAVGTALKLRVVLNPHKKTPARQLRRLHQPAVGRQPAEHKAFRLQNLPVIIVKLIAVPPISVITTSAPVFLPTL